MKYKITALAIIILHLSACSNQFYLPSSANTTFVKPTPEKTYVFNKTMQQVARSIRRDRYYKKISLDTPLKKIWFKQLMYKLWDRQITRKDFVRQGLSKYPNNRYEFSFVAHGFQIR